MKFSFTQKYEVDVLKDIVKLIHKNGSSLTLNESRYISNFKVDFYKIKISTDSLLLSIILILKNIRYKKKTYCFHSLETYLLEQKYSKRKSKDICENFKTF